MPSMPRACFCSWNAPRESVLQLQCLAHRMSQIEQLQKRLEAMKEHAWDVIGSDHQLTDTAERIESIPGFAQLSAIRLIAELAVLADDMSPQQWVAHAGLGPRPLESGSSQRPPRRISKQGNARIRSALFMPALVATQHEPHVAAYYQQLLARGKPKMVALTAVMRRLLHALWGMQHHKQEWDGNKFYPLKAA